MEYISLDGFCIGHIKQNSILREKRLVLGLTQQQVADAGDERYLQSSYPYRKLGQSNIIA